MTTYCENIGQHTSLEKLREEASNIGNAISRNRNLLESLQNKKKKSQMTIDQIAEVKQLLTDLERQSTEMYQKIDKLIEQQK